MKIVAIETIPVSVGVDRQVGTVADPKGFRFTSHLLIIRITTDAGIEGIGEVNGSPDWSGEIQLGSKAVIDRHLAERLVGEDPCRIRFCMSKIARTFANPFVKAGIEMALFDILGKTLEAPLYALLGGTVRSSSLPLRFPIMPVGPEESAAAATRIVDEGCRTIKLKVGHDPLAFDLERVRRVREAVGPDVRLTVDANGGWSVNEAVRASQRLEEYDVAFVEQPVHRLDLEGLAEVRRRTVLPVMADESVFTPQDAGRCIRERAADIISVYPGKNGGILGTMAIVAMAEAAGVHCAIGSNLEWDIASAANAHVTAALPNIMVERYAADIIGPVFHTECALVTPLSVEGWRLTVPEGPGLGVALDREQLAALCD
ncbi:MAG: enolase C-terminal domain-like protein [Trueperaceae bacterium]